MKYDGLRKLEVTVRESSAVVCPAENNAVELPLAEDFALPAEDTVQILSAQTEEPPATEKQKTKRKIFTRLARQVIVAVIIVAALLTLKYIDSDFAADVFQGVKDIVSYNYEVTSPFYEDGAATIVGGILSWFA